MKNQCITQPGGFFRRLSVCFVMALTFSSAPALAATYTWSATPATTNWNTTDSNWTGAGAVWANGNDAEFGGTAGSTIMTPSGLRRLISSAAQPTQAAVLRPSGSHRIALEGSAGSATLERLQDVVLLDSAVHLLREGEVIDADHARIALAEGEQVISFLQLRGRSSVRGGGGPLESMRADEIDLDYRDDGKTVERTALRGGASVTMAADEQTSGRRMSGNRLDLQLAEDGVLTSLEGRGMVSFEIPAVGRNPARRISAGALNAMGEPGKGLVAARFRQNVEFREQGSGAPTREARSQALFLQLDGDAVSSAQFSEGVTFDEQALHATAAEAAYQPGKGLLSLAGSKGAGEPTVTDERIRVDARSIEVTLDGHGMTARDNVRTLLRGRTAGRRAPHA